MQANSTPKIGAFHSSDSDYKIASPSTTDGYYQPSGRKFLMSATKTKNSLIPNISHEYSKSSDLEYFLYNFNGFSFKLPTKLQGVISCLKNAEYILAYKDNWDDEGSEGYSIDTWISVNLFLLEYAKQIYMECGDCIDLPKIYPSSTGSIDIDWETDNYGLIINIAKGGEQATYYGDDKGIQMTEGVFNPKDFKINLLPKAIHSING